MRIATTIFALFVFLNANAENKEIKLKNDSIAKVVPNEQLDNGFLLRNGFGVLSSNYGFPEGAIPKRYQGIIPRYSLGFEIGNYWYLWRDILETKGIAINVNWVDLQVATNSNDIANATIFNLGLSEIGPVFTHTLGPDIGLDLYFNTRINVVKSSFEYNYYYDNDPNQQPADYNESGMGLTYAVGANFRWQILLLGVEYGFGNISISTNDYNSNYRQKINMGLLKFMVGLKL